MKTEKKYIDCLVTTHSGRSFYNPLKLSEAHLISQLLQENKCLTASIRTVTDKQYKLIFK